MKTQHMKLGLVAICMPTLWLMASFLGQQSSQKDRNKKARIHSTTCNCPEDTFRNCMCLSGIHKCSACLHSPGDSDWFDKRFERAIEPLLSSEEPMSADALLLWLIVGIWDKPLHSSLLCYELQGMKSEKEFQNQKQQPIKMSLSHPLARVESSCRTCAVVGNSRSLLGSGLGFRIDQHDMVLRMNQAPVRGFERDVGNMTTIRMMQPGVAHIQDPATQLLMLPLNASGLKWFMRALENQDVIWKLRNPGFQIVQFPNGSKERNDKLSIISLTFLQYVQDHWLHAQPSVGNTYIPSLGLVALFYALHTCDQVSLFGFGTDKFLRWSHYWEDKYWFTSHTYSFEREKQLISKLQCEGKVAFYS